MLLNVLSHFQLSLTRRRMETVSLLLLLTSLLLFVDFLLWMVSVDRRRQTGLRKTGSRNALAILFHVHAISHKKIVKTVGNVIS